jgi:hypothetical protein
LAQLKDKQLIQALWAEGLKLADIREGLAKTHSWHTHDIRLAVFTKIENAVCCTALGLESITEILTLPRRLRNGELRNPIGPNETHELGMFYKLGFIHFVFSATESSLRQMLRACNPSACSNGTADFKSIYECLIRTELVLEPVKDWIDLLDLFRLIRNTIHNNGVYLQKSGADTEVTYQGKLYQFKHGRKIDIVWWDLCLAVLSDVISLFIALTAHARVISLTHTKDASA